MRESTAAEEMAVAGGEAARPVSELLAGRREEAEGALRGALEALVPARQIVTRCTINYSTCSSPVSKNY